MAGRDPPYFANTDEDRGAVVAVVTFTFAIVVTLTNGIRVWIRQGTDGALGIDDALLVGANVITIVQTVLVGTSVKDGLGRHIDTLSDHSIAQYQKTSYGASLLAILAMTLAKYSTLYLHRRICGLHTSDRYVKIMQALLGGGISVWAIFSLFALAFQCGSTTPEFFAPQRCRNGSLWYPVTIGNAITDAVLALWLAPIMLKLNAKVHMKIKIICLLGSRILVCIAAIVQTAVLPQALTAVDQTRRMLGPVTMQQIVMNLSTLAAIVMSLHGFLSNMAAGRFGVEIRESEYELSEVSNSKSRGIAGSKRARSSAHRRPARKIDSQLSAVGEMKNLPGFRKNGDLMGKNLAWVAEPARDWEDGERSDGSQENIIRQTTTWQISRSDPGVSREEDELHMLSKSGESSKTGTRDFLE